MSLATSLMFKAGLDMRPAERALIEFRGKAETIGRTLGTIRTAAVGIGATLGAGFLAGAAAIKSAMDAGAEMETFESRLTTLMGSATEARARMGELFEFASSTPFELTQVVGAEATLRGFGAAAEELMPGLIDFSATVGSDLAQSAIDFGKAWNQGATGLESDTARILRRQIEIRTGTDATKLSLEEFRAAMLETLDEGMFAGGADRLSKTFSGMVSNLQDEWARFRMTVADAGLFDNMKGVLSETLALIGSHREYTAELASLVSGALWGAFKGVAYTIAGMVDMARSLGGWMLIAGEAAADFVSTTAGGLAAIDRRLGALADSAGLTATADGYRTAALGLEEFAQSADAFAAGAAERRATLMGDGSTAVSQLIGLFGRAEEAAKTFGTEAEAAQAKAAGGTGDGVDGKEKKAQDDLLQRFEAAQSFTDSILALGRTQVQEEQALYAERMTALLDYQEQGLVTGQRFTDARVAIEREYADAIALMQEEQAQKDLERRKQYNDTVIGSTSSLLGTIAGLMDENNAKQKAASKAFGIAQIAISTAVGISKAFEQFGWPLGIAPAALVAASGVAQVAAVAQAHQGGMGPSVVYAHQGRGPAPDERDVRVLNTEPVLNSQAGRALGERGVEAINSGRTPQTNLTLNIGRTQQREIFRDELRGGMGQLRSYVTDLVGGGVAPGFSGAAAAA